MVWLSFPDAGSVFSVPHQVAEIFIAEQEIVNIVNRSASRLDISLQDVEFYMESWSSRVKELRSDNLEDVLERLVGNPVHVFNLMERLVLLLPNIVQGMTDVDREEMESSLAKLPEKPDESDVEGAMQALIRVQFAYK